MTRRSVRKLPTVPKGWREHDGTRMPVHHASMPAVLFRIGTRIAVGKFTAAHWADRAKDSWTWKEPGPMDIIAYLPEPDEVIDIPVMKVDWPEPR